MGRKIGKLRHNPDKPQNKYGSKCWYADEVNGKLVCEWSGKPKSSEEVMKICKGNMHNCCKLKYRRLAASKKGG